MQPGLRTFPPILTLLFLCLLSSDLRAVASDTSSVSLADSLYLSKDYKAAEKAYKKMLGDDEDSERALRGLAAIAFHKEDWGDVKDWGKKLRKLLPNDPEAGYRLAIAYRETGKFKAFIMKKLDFDKSEEYFDAVISRDSSYQDVLFQRAILEKLRTNWKEAIRWGRLQAKIKPELPAAHTGVFRFYRLYLKNEDVKDFRAYLMENESDWSEFFLGESYSRNGELAQADTVFEKLLDRERDIIRYRTLLSVVRLKVQQEELLEAGRFFEIAIDSITSHTDAEFLFEESKYIFTDEELHEFRSLKTPEEKREFFRVFWAERNPIPVSPVNVRALGHFKRLIGAEANFWFDGLRSWFNNPDQAGDLDFPEVYALNEEFNDKGLIYIRHGAPDDRAVTVDANIPSNESWLYYEWNERPELIFHFLVGSRGSGANWRLSPYLPGAMLGDRLGWSARIDRLLLGNRRDRPALQHEMIIEARQDVTEALTTDYHTWGSGVTDLTSPCYWSFFKGPDNKTRVEIYLGIPIGELAWQSGVFDDVKFEHGAGLFDSKLNTIDRSYEKLELSGRKDARVHHDQFIERYVFDIAPQKARLSYFAMKEEPRKVGGGNFEVEIPEFSDAEIDMSDLELAYEIKTDGLLDLYQNRDLTIIPNPSREFDRARPVTVYFEIYNLSRDQEGETLIEVESEMTQLKGKKKFLGLFGGGDKKSLSITNRISGEEEMVYYHTSFDVQKLDGGEYRLSVKVKDLNAGEKVERSINLTLLKD